MKASQKLKIRFENIETIQRFGDLDNILLPLAAKLEKEGDIYGPVCMVYDGHMCIAMRYADKRREPVNPTIFGYDSEEFLAKQYK